MKLRGELRMIERALKQGWDTPVEKQRESMELVFATLDDPNATSREQAAALRVLGAFIQADGATDAEILKRARDAERLHLAK
jgi:hypothetical protein